MMRSEFSLWWLAGVTVLVLASALLFQLSPRARLRRRRRKSHSPILSGSRQPSVKFSVKTPRK